MGARLTAAMSPLICSQRECRKSRPPETDGLVHLSSNATGAPWLHWGKFTLAARTHPAEVLHRAGWLIEQRVSAPPATARPARSTVSAGVANSSPRWLTDCGLPAGSDWSAIEAQ